MLRVIAVSLLVGLGGCQDSALDLSSATTSKVVVGAAAPVALQSIEGLPGELSPRFAAVFSAEAQAREITFVDASQKPRFRVKGYVDAFRSDNGNTVSWVFDVFDSRSSRAQRISGSEVISRSGEPWSGLDEKVMRYVAARSLNDIGAFLIANRPADASGTPVAGRKATETARASAEP